MRSCYVQVEFVKPSSVLSKTNSYPYSCCIFHHQENVHVWRPTVAAGREPAHLRGHAHRGRAAVAARCHAVPGEENLLGLV